jgi:hypothetical protein
MDGGCTKIHIYATFRIIRLITKLCKRAKNLRTTDRQHDQTAKDLNASSHRGWRCIERLIEQASFEKKVNPKDLDDVKLGQTLELSCTK